MTVEQLVKRLDRAVRTDDNAKFRRLFWQMEAIEDELKVRKGDQRRALLQLYLHASVQVRLAAAKGTLAVAPEYRSPARSQKPLTSPE